MAGGDGLGLWQEPLEMKAEVIEAEGLGDVPMAVAAAGPLGQDCTREPTHDTERAMRAAKVGSKRWAGQG